jgi:hypothetical protein
MGSFAEGSTTFDMKTSSSVYFEAMEQGSFDPETAPDGVWDYMTAYSHTTSTYYDSVKIVGPADETGDPTVFRMHWQAKANKLIFSQSALEISTDIPSFGDIDLGGGLSRLDNGYFTNVNYEVTMNAFANQQLQTPTYSVDKLEPFLPPVQGDSLPLDETKNLDDIDLIYEVPAQVNIPFVLQVDLAALMDVELFVTSTATPTIFSRLDLTQTFDSVAFDVLDEFGNVRNDVTIESQIGIDYAGAAPTAVPEPSGALMLLIVMTALAGTKRYCRQSSEVRG